MLARTLSALVALNYKHETWVLDEGDEPAVRQLCEGIGARHFSRKGLPQFQTHSGQFERACKHGNYNAWLVSYGFAHYDFIANFDPDHIPEPNFLSAVLGHFDDNRVGYVQTAQAYYNQEASFVARGAAEESYGYYSVIQAAASRYGYPVVTGCHTTHRVTALQSVNGFAAHPADDVLITRNYREAGWRGVYLPEILARGLAPVSWRSYIDQQRRWARSLLDLKLRRSYSSRPAHALIQAMQGVRYFLDGFCILSLAFLIVLALAGVRSALPALGIAAEAGCVFFLTNLYKQRFYLDPATECGIPWRAYLLRLVKWPYTFAAVFDVITKRPFGYTTTRKDGIARRESTVMAPQLILAFAIASAWVVGWVTGHIVNSSLHLLAGLGVAIPLAAAATGRIRFPAAYDRKLLSVSPRCRILGGVDLLLGFSIAVFFLLWPLRTLGGTAALQDSARHLMNGVFIYDLFRTGHVFDPLRFAHQYFARFPALSMPYHPPVFPALEAVLFAAFDVRFTVARLAIALTVSLSAFLLYRLVLNHGASALIAATVCGSFLFLDMSAYLEQDIMLEFPALVFVLAAMLSLQRMEVRGFSWGAGVSFGLWAVAGMFTKQTVFVALVPFLYFALMRNRMAFARPAVWAGAAISAASGILLALVSIRVGLRGIPHNWAPMSLTDAIVHNCNYYLQAMPGGLRLFVLATVASAVLILWRTSIQGLFNRATWFYLAWMTAALTIVLVSPAYDSRYLFFAMPPLVALTCELMQRAFSALFPPAKSAVLVAVAGGVFCVLHLVQTPVWLTGPDIAARRISDAGMNSVMYSGSSNGAFTFATRLFHPDLRAAVLRADKLLDHDVLTDKFEELARTYALDAVAIESPRAEDMDWQLRMSNSKTLKFWFRQEIDSSFPFMRATLFVFRVSDQSRSPQRLLHERIDTLGKNETFSLDIP
jgi:hypothetical protein